MPAITSANVASAIVKLVAADALPALIGELILGNLVNRDYEPVLANAGDTVNIPIPPTLVANNLAEGGTVQTQNPSLGNAQIVINTHAEATFQIPDVTRILAVPDLLKVYMQPAVNAIAAKVEGDLFSAAAQFTLAQLGGSTAITEATIDSAETNMFTAELPATTPKFLVVSAQAFSEMRQIPRFTEYQTVGPLKGDAIMSKDLPGAGPFGAHGRIKDFFVFRSQYVPYSSGTWKNIAFAKDALGLVIRRLPQPLPGTGAIAEYAELGNFGMRVTMSYQPNTLAQQITVDCLYGTNALRGNFGGIILNN